MTSCQHTLIPLFVFRSVPCFQEQLCLITWEPCEHPGPCCLQNRFLVAFPCCPHLASSLLPLSVFLRCTFLDVSPQQKFDKPLDFLTFSTHLSPWAVEQLAEKVADASWKYVRNFTVQSWMYFWINTIHKHIQGSCGNACRIRNRFAGAKLLAGPKKVAWLYANDVVSYLLIMINPQQIGMIQALAFESSSAVGRAVKQRDSADGARKILVESGSAPDKKYRKGP